MTKASEPIHSVARSSRKGLKWAQRRMKRAVGDAETQPVTDVWHWTRSKYRWRSVILLLTNALLFAGLGCFAYWLRSGDITPFSSPDYWNRWWLVFDPTLPKQVTLMDYLVYPIPVEQVPMMIVIVGLVLASLAAIPVLVSMLYRFPFSLVFTCIIAFLAVLPWLAITVTICCWLARWRRVQFSFRYATGLVSLLPLILYYLLATRNASGLEDLPPLEMAKLYLPWVVAMIASCILMGLVLLIARLVNYRPGAIAPLLALMFAIPVVLFELKVGRDELRYRLLETRFSPGSTQRFLTELDAGTLLRRVAQQRLEAFDDERATYESVLEQVRVAFRLEVASGQVDSGEVFHLLNEDFETERHQAIMACQWFRSHFPESRYIPNALYIQGRVTDMRLDRHLSLFQDAVILHYREDFPRAASKPIWQELYDRVPESPLASVAMFRLGVLEARQGHVVRAINLLTELDNRFGEPIQESALPGEPASWFGFFAKRPASGSLGVEPAAVAFEGRKLLDLLVHNRVIELEGHYDYPVLQKMLSCDPGHPAYRRNLQKILASITPTNQYSPTRLRDNLQVYIAVTDPSRTRRIERLKQLISQFNREGSRDALPQAQFELGVAYQSDNLWDEARTMFETARDTYPDSPWSIEAARRLATMARPETGFPQ